MIKARKRMMKLLKETVLKKRASGAEFGEFFKIIVGETTEGEEEKMSIENAIEYIYTFGLIANETTPRILAATFKLISENPKVMQELQREHAEVVRDKTGNDAGLTWEDYKSMTFTKIVSIPNDEYKKPPTQYQFCSDKYNVLFQVINESRFRQST